MSDAMDWIVIKGHGNIDIGAVGFLGNDAVAVVAFFDDLDGDKSGDVGIGEWIAGKISPISMEGSAVTEVAMAGRFNMDILQRDPSFSQMAADMFSNFARGLVIDGIFAVYFKAGVSMGAGAIAKKVTSGMVKEFVIKKGSEALVKKAFMEAVDR